jgi:hypothetical protein
MTDGQTTLAGGSVAADPAADRLREAMSQCTGTTQYHNMTFPPYLHCTDGVLMVAEMAGGFWLFDAIASYQPRVKGMEFQLWELAVTADHKAVLTCRADKDMPVIVRQRVSLTDFPTGQWKFYVEGKAYKDQNGNQHLPVCLLPMEH